jgi:hypothetical protein
MKILDVLIKVFAWSGWFLALTPFFCTDKFLKNTIEPIAIAYGIIITILFFIGGGGTSNWRNGRGPDL